MKYVSIPRNTMTFVACNRNMYWSNLWVVAVVDLLQGNYYRPYKLSPPSTSGSKKMFPWHMHLSRLNPHKHLSIRVVSKDNLYFLKNVIIIKTTILLNNLDPLLAILFRPFKYLAFQSLTLTFPDENYFRNTASELI